MEDKYADALQVYGSAEEARCLAAEEQTEDDFDYDAWKEALTDYQEDNY